MKKKTRRFIAICLCVSIVASLFSGCNDMTYQEAMKYKLEKKYGKEFEVSEATECVRKFWLDPVTYSAEATDIDSGKNFKVYIDEDKKTIEDQYASVVFDDVISESLDNIYAQHPEIDITNEEHIFWQTEDTWDSIEMLEDYKKSGKYRLSIDCTVEGDDVDTVTDNVYWFINDIYMLNFKVSIWFKYTINGQEYKNIVSVDHDDERFTREYVEEKIANEVNKSL